MWQMKKKILLLSLAICCLVALFGDIRVGAEENRDVPEQLYARSAVLMDADSGRVLFGKEESEIRPMASTTKIMTCILALENQEEGQIVTVSGYAAGQPKVRLGVREKEQFLLRDLLYSLMLESHNDSAVVIAEGISGTVKEFAGLMNQKARELGCMDTHFVTPNGLDESDEGGIHSTMARDLAMIMRYCISQSPCREEFLEITRAKNYQFSDVADERTFYCVNHNAFLDMMDGALSGKTGFTSDAGYCYVGALTRDGRTFIVALLACGWPNNKSYKWKDTRKLMEYGIANYEYRDVWEEVKLPQIQVTEGVKKEDPYDTRIHIPLRLEGKREIPVLMRSGESAEVITDLKEQVSAPVEEGENVGQVRYLLDGNEIASFKVVTDEGVKKRDMKWAVRWVLHLLLMQGGEGALVLT